MRKKCTEVPYLTICNPNRRNGCWGIVVFHLLSQHRQFVHEVEKYERNDTTIVTSNFLQFHRRVKNMKYSVANKKVLQPHNISTSIIKLNNIMKKMQTSADSDSNQQSADEVLILFIKTIEVELQQKEETILKSLQGITIQTYVKCNKCLVERCCGECMPEPIITLDKSSLMESLADYQAQVDLNCSCEGCDGKFSERYTKVDAAAGEYVIFLPKRQTIDGEDNIVVKRMWSKLTRHIICPTSDIDSSGSLVMSKTWVIMKDITIVTYI